jgi:hypothetical protein
VTEFPASEFHPDRPGLVRPLRVDPAGVLGPTPSQVRGRAWRRTSNGLFVPTGVDGSRPEQRIVEAAEVLPRYGGITGWAALRWAGGRWFDGLAAGGRVVRPVVLATGGLNVRHQPGLRVCKEKLDPRDLTAIDDLRITTHVRSVCFEMRYAASVRDAVRVFDMAAFSDLVSLEEMSAYALAHAAWTGIPQCREALTLGEENSWSPAEVSMRIVWRVDAGLPRPLCNVPLFTLDGRHIGTPDLFDPVAGVVGEYDGSLHLEGPQRARDVRRAEAFRRVGLEYFTVLAPDLADRTLVVERMQSTRDRALWLPEGQRAWTLVSPPWWTPTLTVAQRRGLRGEQRRRLLRHRTG